MALPGGSRGSYRVIKGGCASRVLKGASMKVVGFFGRRESLEMVQRYTRSVSFSDSLRF